MKPTVGDIFGVYTPRLDAYTAVQVTAVRLDGKDAQACVLALDSVGSSHPDAAAVAAMRPATFNFFFWKEHHIHLGVPVDVPPGYTHVGRRPPLLEEKSVTYGDWPSGNSLFSQRRWERIPQAARDLFRKTVANEDTSELVTQGGLELRRSTRTGDG